MGRVALVVEIVIKDGVTMYLIFTLLPLSFYGLKVNRLI
jgi:hypothetical protein